MRQFQNSARFGAKIVQNLRVCGGKVVSWDELLCIRQKLRSEGKVVVWTNGCFDLFHAGHLRSLQAAGNLGDILVVGLNSDESVRKLKGIGRPILAAADRGELLASLVCVHYVVFFDELTPEACLARLQPEIHCKGEDYGGAGKPIPEAEVVEQYGGRVAFLPLIAGISTTEIIRRIQRLGKDADA
jgi:rfaE bifunctional protein nucleotidyltransferase chain/domain